MAKSQIPAYRTGRPNPRIAVCNLRFIICSLFLIFNLIFGVSFLSAKGTDDLELTLDVTSNTIPLPKIFKPNIDLSGRGFHREVTWPQGMAAGEVLDT